MFSDPASSLYWPPDVARYDMETRTACIVLALFWVAFRAYQVLSQPVDKLVQVLGLEVPVAPLVSLAGIKADGLLLHWKSPERASVLKYVIRINGIDVGHVAPHDTSVTIENLLPDHHYTLRVVTFNASHFQAPSVPIRLRTLPADSDQYYAASPPSAASASASAASPADDANAANPTPVIRPNKSLVDVATPFAAPVMAREHSNSTSRARRPDVARRGSPASLTADDARAATDSTDSIRALTEKLDALRRDLDDMDRQIQDEDQDFVTQRLVLIDKRDEKKAALKEKEDASRDLRKEVATLERQSAAAQTRRTHQERLFRQKEAERKKMKDDVAKWTRESVELRETAENIKKEQDDYKVSSQKRIQEIKDKYDDEIQANKVLEDAIREKGIQIKALEEERKELEEGQEGGEAPDGTDYAEREEDNRWKMTLGLLQQQYAQAWQLFIEADRANQEASSRLQYLQQRRMSQPQLYDDLSVPRVGPVRRNSQRQRPLSMREGLLNGPPGGFVQSSSAPFNSMTATSSPPFASVTPYFNPVNGMALPPRGHGHTPSLSQMSQADLESLTGGAPMSPTAGALLPAGLFGDDLGLTDNEDDDLFGPPRLSSLEPSPNMRNVLPGLGAVGHVDPPKDPYTPVSPPESRSPSVFASPRESGQLQFYPNPENIDPDKRSIQSSSSSFMNSQSRFGGLFGLNRQRGKTISGQGPALGSLTQSQSQSLPRQEFGLDSAGASRRRGSTEGAWYDSFMRTKTQPVESSSSPKHVATRKRTFNMFGTKNDPWLTSVLGMERPSSPRQGSTKSGEGMALPRPSTESQTRFGWGIDAFGARSSPLGVDWSVNNTNTSSWSRMPSRRPSIQHGSTTNLVNEDFVHDDILDFPSNVRSPMQAPIGTRPQSSASHMPSRDYPPMPETPPTALNPAAATFTMFQLGKKSEEDKAEKAKRAAEKAAEKEAKRAEKAEKKEKTKAEKSKGKDKDKQVAFEASADGSHPTSPYETFSRPSRDTPSIISTADVSEASPRESLERSVSQATSDHAGSIGKESFMQKLTRKGSTSQFLSFGKKNPLFAKKGDVPSTPDEAEEDSGGFFGLGKSTESISHHNSPSIGTPKDKSSALSWGSIKRMGRKDKTPSLHESIASEATGDEEHDEGAEGLGLKV
ncbi:hypothetical protein N0V95_004307 [Ascochyta clinopodiicola]|nr:hypothetical protein N0V95_004307 [Ascochyta clinopodiicola]